MHKLKLRLYPDPILLQKAAPVARFGTDEVDDAVEQMLRLLKEHDGVGLAAPQVGLPWRLFVTDLPDDGPPRVYINPKITFNDKHPEHDVVREGCLSIPGLWLYINRRRVAVMEYQNIQGELNTDVGIGLHARVWQHEVDHLDGILIMDPTRGGTFATDAGKL